ncbi:MAG: DUF3899 domain-containing protein, partial [Clostridia bacterium]|nr:DUF3899 domain-containing protein [Clostridia bacterium]
SMKKDKSEIIKTVIKYGIAFICGALITVALLIYLKPSQAENRTQLYKILCDAFTVPGLLLIFAGTMVWLSGQGAFTGIGYLFRYLTRSLIPGGRTAHPHETFYDYVQEQKEKRKATGYGFLFFVGLFYFTIAIVFFILFYASLK